MQVPNTVEVEDAGVLDLVLVVEVELEIDLLTVLVALDVMYTLELVGTVDE